MNERIEQFKEAILNSQKLVRLNYVTKGNRKFQILFRGAKPPEKSRLQIYEGKDWHFTSFGANRWILLQDFNQFLESI